MLTDNSEWALINVRVQRRHRPGVAARYEYTGYDEDTYTELTYTVHIRRRALYYAFNVIVPCVRRVLPVSRMTSYEASPTAAVQRRAR